ncbi:hypothetical protein [Ectopseudomonas composti]|jgi:hypothetical protein|uniref:hypothetical protein n=1 Tax=Ectopseudomonas composti TaxID=658457 RepID=UPI00103FCC2D|nr:hypothetical protein [Pseudomonas composti]
MTDQQTGAGAESFGLTQWVKVAGPQALAPLAHPASRLDAAQYPRQTHAEKPNKQANTFD